MKTQGIKKKKQKKQNRNISQGGIGSGETQESHRRKIREKGMN